MSQDIILILEVSKDFKDRAQIQYFQPLIFNNRLKFNRIVKLKLTLNQFRILIMNMSKINIMMIILFSSKGWSKLLIPEILYFNKMTSLLN